MSLITPLSPDTTKFKLPKVFPSPFNNTPHPIAQLASIELQNRLNDPAEWQHDFDAPDGGKMLGVLVVQDNAGQLGFLSSFSGMLAGRWQLPGFVPPLFNLTEREAFLPAGESELAIYNQEIQKQQQTNEYIALQTQLIELRFQQNIEIEALKKKNRQQKDLRRQQRRKAPQDTLLARLAFESQQDKRAIRELIAQWHERLAAPQAQLNDIETQITRLKSARAELSNQLHRSVFDGYRLLNRLGEKKLIASFFSEGLPPGGAGDCAAPKLIQYAHQQKLKPIALAEFWWGAAPKKTVRHHGHFYPACRGKCHPILPFMLQGLDLQIWQSAAHHLVDANAPPTVYEDADLLVVNKPWGLLSIPGKEVDDSVFTRMKQRYPQATGALLVHRLDMSTSGLILIAKNAVTHKALQKQFLNRTVEKRYVAVLSKRLPTQPGKGDIDLPLRVDLDDRPRQMICYAHGKPAKTHWQIIKQDQDTTRVYLYPVTGRTHQLRVHAAHQDGLNAAIVGDELYGQPGERLLLHAERLCFTHPRNNKRIELEVSAPF